jgi:GNAT superfamily N-acetyltransferase
MSALVDSANARVFSARAAGALGGERQAADRVASHVSSRLDPFLNQVFVDVGGDPEEAVRRLAGRPSFVWLASPPDAVTRVRMEADGFALRSFTAMHADIADEPVAEPSDTPIEPVDTGEGLAAWHCVYCEGLGADPRSVDDWRKLYRDLGPGGDGSLSLWLLRVDGAPAATAALFVDGETAGLYCFATLAPYRRRGLASELISVCRRHARRSAARRCVLQASAAGRPVYARAGFAPTGELPLMIRR